MCNITDNYSFFRHLPASHRYYLHCFIHTGFAKQLLTTSSHVVKTLLGLIALADSLLGGLHPVAIRATLHNGWCCLRAGVEEDQPPDEDQQRRQGPGVGPQKAQEQSDAHCSGGHLFRLLGTAQRLQRGHELARQPRGPGLPLRRGHALHLRRLPPHRDELGLLQPHSVRLPQRKLPPGVCQLWHLVQDHLWQSLLLLSLCLRYQVCLQGRPVEACNNCARASCRRGSPSRRGNAGLNSAFMRLFFWLEWGGTGFLHTSLKTIMGQIFFLLQLVFAER